MKVAIVEDEEVYAKELAELLTRYAKEKNLSLTIDFFIDGLDMAETYEPQWDILFLDIALPHLDGMELARRIRKVDQAVILIFITSMAQYAIQGYEVDAQDFILKPASYPALTLRLDKAIKRLSRDEERYLLLPLDGKKQKVPAFEILYVEVHNHNLDLHTKGCTYHIRHTLSDLEETLKGCHFSRSTNSYLVNLAHVESLSQDTVQVGEISLPVSRTRKKPFMKDLSDYLGVEC